MSPGDPSRRPKIAALVASCLASCALWTQARSEEPGPLPLSVEALDGREVVLRPGAPALHVVFFATWCPPCMDEMRDLADLESRWVGRGYRLALVAVPSRQTRERLGAFVKESSPPGEVLFDQSGSATRAAGAERLPLHLVLDAKGAVVARSGNIADGVDAAVARLLGGPRRGERR